MDAFRALKLAQGALGGVKILTADQIRERVAGRYPDALPLPGWPELNVLLAATGLELHWDAAALGGRGGYVSLSAESDSITSASTPPPRKPTALGRDPREPLSPEEADTRQFEEKLRRSLKDRAFLTLLVPQRAYEQARSGWSTASRSRPSTPTG